MEERLQSAHPWRLNIRGVKQEQLDSLNAPEKLRYALGENIPFELLAVRPDGHVAWRGESLPGNAAEVIDRVRGAC